MRLDEEIRAIIKHSLSPLDLKNEEAVLDHIMDNLMYILERDWEIEYVFKGRHREDDK